MTHVPFIFLSRYAVVPAMGYVNGELCEYRNAGRTFTRWVQRKKIKNGMREKEKCVDKYMLKGRGEGKGESEGKGEGLGQGQGEGRGKGEEKVEKKREKD